MSSLLRKLFLPSLLQRRLATALSLLAIALGVALGLAVQLIHDAALEEFGEGVRRLSGLADFQVVGPREGFDERLYGVLALRPEVAEASPILEVEARIPGAASTLRIIGIDLFRVAAVQPGLVPIAETEPGESVDRLAGLRERNLFLTVDAERELFGERTPDVGVGHHEIVVQSGLTLHRLRHSGVLPATGGRLGVMDIASAQTLFGRTGTLTRIDIRIAEGLSRQAALDALAPLLPAGVVLRRVDEAAGEAGALSRAYRVNLTMLAAIALLTGGFLVFSAQWLAVSRRQREFALLRALGLDRRQLMHGLLAEGAVIGSLGGVAGVALGHALAAVTFRVAGADLGAGFFQGLVPTLQFDPLLSAAYLLLGVLAGVAGTGVPAREAARVVPARALHAGAPGAAAMSAMHRRTGAALAALSVAMVACLLPPVSDIPVGGYVAVAAVLGAAVLALPALTHGLARLLARGRHPVWRLARARFVAAAEQVVVASAGVVASVALASAMAIMVSSFRGSVDDWLSQVLPADLYLRASSASASGFLDAEAVERIRALPGVASADSVRAIQLRLDASAPQITLLARGISEGWGLPLVSGTLAPLSDSRLPSAWISEALADRGGLSPGDELELPIAGTMHRFAVAGIWRDYARQHGAVVIERQLYEAISGDSRINDVSIRLKPGQRADEVVGALQRTFGEDRTEIARPGEIRALTLQVFDRTFLITYLMEAVAVTIGLFGIATTFAAQAVTRKGEFGMLRHLGFTRGEIGRLLAFEGAFAAGAGVLVGLAGGGAISLILVEVINRQSFHWSMDLSIPFGALATFALSLVALAAAVARLAARHVMSESAVLAVKEDW